jgi:hypothetical protein
MAISSLDALCAGYCEIAGVPAPDLQPDDRGIVAFNLKRRDVVIDLLHSPSSGVDNIFVLFHLGPFGADEWMAGRAMRQLLAGNFLLLDATAPTFSCNPTTGNAFMQYVVPFFETSPTALHELIEAGVAKTLAWREAAADAAAQEPHRFHSFAGEAT